MKGSAILALTIGLLTGMVMGFIVAVNQPQTSGVSPATTSVNQTENLSKEEFKMNMRKIWGEHIIWTRMYIVSVVNDNPDSETIKNRLLNNQEDLGNAIKPYYGTSSGDRLTALLKAHIVAASDLVSAAKAADQTKMDQANDRLERNGNEIADFFSNSNPNLPKSEMRAMIKDHIDLLKKQTSDLLSKNYDAGVRDFDNSYEQMLKLSDTLSEGIIRQFSDKF